MRVWWLDRRTQRWYFYDPDPLFAVFNTLKTIAPGEVVVIKVTGPAQFKGERLFAGWNYLLIR